MAADAHHLLRGARGNAIVSWILVTLLVGAAGVSAYRGDLLWMGFALVVCTLAVLPPLGLRDPIITLPWEVTALAALPVLGRSFATVPVTNELGTYFSVAAIALVVAVELHLFTPVRMTDGFAVAFVVVATLATAGLWAVVRWSLDLTLGTAFLLDPALSEDLVERRLMWEFVASTAAGVLGGLVFAFYVRRYVDTDTRFPEEVPR